MKNSNNIFLFVGPPGSGKGTLAHLCVQRYGWEQVSTGNLCRMHIERNSTLGNKIKKVFERGDLISDDIIIEMLQEWMIFQKNMNANIIFDGYPRTGKQIGQLYTLTQDFLQSYRFILVWFKIDKNILLDRILSRVICSDKTCQKVYSLKNNAFIESCDVCSAPLIKRADDTREVLMNRLDTYYQHEKEIIAFCKNKAVPFIEINAMDPVEVVFQNFKTSLDQV
ncbi:nucleoside monophosphate kinase [Candidatus Dependentiae bacterium]|nr:nucleoside monophosphate kinase [Candidatus Dependentiae bacterium]